MRFHTNAHGNVPFTDEEEAQADIDAANYAKPTVPQQVLTAHARIALNRAGMMKAAQDALSNMAGQVGEEARIMWEYHPVIRRNSPLVIQTADALGMTSDQLDQLFIMAETL